MAAKIKKAFKYSPELAETFFALCQQGLSLTQIASTMGVIKQRLLDWAKDKRKFEFQNAWERGREACQAYHEALLDKMIKAEDKKYASSEIAAQQYRLRVMFKEDWSDKQESKLEITGLQTLSDQELEAQLTKMLSKPVARKLFDEIKGGGFAAITKLRAVSDSTPDKSA